MPITLRHDVADLPMPKVDPQKYNTGMGMAKQERKYAMDAEMLNQRQDYAMDAMQMRNSQENPSIGDDDAMVEQEIRSGLYDPDTVRSLRDDQRAARLILRDRNLNATQQAEALANLRSRMRMTRSTGKVQPMMQQMSPAALQAKPPMTEADYFSDEKNYANAYAAAQARLEAAGSNTPATPENIQAQMHNDYLARQKFLEGLRQPQGQGQPAAPAPNAPATQSGQPQASFSGGQSIFGASPVLAQGGFQQGGSAYSPAIALAPAHPDYKPLPTPTDRRDERGYVIMSDGSKVDPRDSFAMSTGGRGQQDVMRLTHPDGSQKEQRPANILEYYDSNAPVGQPLTQGSFTGGDPVFGSPPVLAMPASQSMPGVATGATLPATPMSQQPAQQQPMYPMEAIASMRVDPGYKAQPPAATGVRNWTSSDGKFNVDGQLEGVDPASGDGAYPTVRIKRSDNGKVISVPMNRISNEDQMFAMAGGNRNTMYDMQNPQRSAGTNFMDPNNPVRQEMSAADQSIVNPQKRTLGSEYKGRYGLGGADYGINPATGNRVTASVRPGGTALEYDEPVGAPGTAMGGRKGSLNYLGGKRKVDQKKKAPVVGVDVSPNASPATELDAASAIESAKAVIADPNATTQDKYDAARSLVRSGVPEEEVVRLENAAKPTTTVKPATPTTTPVQPATPQQNANAVKRKRPMLSASTPLDKDGKPVQDPISSGAQWIYDQGSDAAIAARRWYYGFPDENNASPAPKPASTKPSVASQESRDWQNWWSTNRPDFESSGGEPSTWTSAKDSKKKLTGSVLRISEFTEGTRYVSIKDEKGRVFTLDIKRLSGADQKKLKDMYKAKKNESAGVKK